MSWDALRDELALWRRDGMVLPIWWRDDDAVADTAALVRLGRLAERLDLAIHLAVIPAEATAFGGAPFRMMVHGWSHRNHAPPGEKKAEFRAHRPLEARLTEARTGLARIEALFRSDACAVFVPPWNRVDEDMAPGLAAMGYRGLSAFGARGGREVGGLVRVNTHLDPIDWRGTRSLVDPDRLLAQVVHDLGERRAGRADATEPYGVLTHHLVHDGAIWDFSARLLATLLEGGARPMDFTREDLP